MSEKYLASLGSYLILNTAIWILTTALFGAAYTVIGFVLMLCVATVIHRLLFWRD